MKHRFALLSVCLMAGLFVAPPLASAGQMELPLIPCSTPGFSVCFQGGGTLMFTKGSIFIDTDGEVTVSWRGVTGSTAVESGPPYTFQVFFFNIPLVNHDASPIIAVGAPFTTKVNADQFGNHSGSIGYINGPAVGFFTINSAGTGGDFVNSDLGAREQFITGIPGINNTSGNSSAGAPVQSGIR